MNVPKSVPNMQLSLLKPWAVVIHPGTDDEEVYAEFWNWGEAQRYGNGLGIRNDVMRRGENGVLTTEF